MNLKFTLAIILFYLCSSGRLNAQQFHFAQYNFTPLKVNPGLVATDNEAKAIVHFRNQQSNADVAFKSNMVTATYPLIAKETRRRWAGLGLSVLDDRAEGAGVFINQSIALNFAYNIPIKTSLQLSLGFQGNYNLRKFSSEGVRTGTQYWQGRFDSSQKPGENFTDINTNNISFSSGFFLSKTDIDGKIKYYTGLSIYDFNKPNFSASGQSEPMPSTAIYTSGWRIYNSGLVEIIPEILYTVVSRVSNINIGSTFSFNLQNSFVGSSGKFDVATRYVVGKSAAMSLRLIKPHYFIGFSYDVSMNSGSRVSRQNGLELAFGIKKAFKPREKNAKKKAKDKKKARKKAKRKLKKKNRKNKKKKNAKSLTKTGEKKPVNTQLIDSQLLNTPEDNELSLSNIEEGMETSEVIEQEAIIVRGKGIIRVNEILRNFEFELNSVEIKESSIIYLDHLATLLNQYTELTLTINGHTDDIGDAEENMLLSEKRALVVKDHLVKKGIDSDRIIAEGKGETEPIFSNKTEMERAKNRRVDFEISE